jgi:hypothetical protein
MYGVELMAEIEPQVEGLQSRPSQYKARPYFKITSVRRLAEGLEQRAIDSLRSRRL